MVPCVHVIAILVAVAAAEGNFSDEDAYEEKKQWSSSRRSDFLGYRHRYPLRSGFHFGARVCIHILILIHSSGFRRG